MPEELPKVIINNAGLPYFSLPLVDIGSEPDKEFDADKVILKGNGPAG